MSQFRERSMDFGLSGMQRRCKGMPCGMISSWMPFREIVSSQCHKIPLCERYRPNWMIVFVLFFSFWGSHFYHILFLLHFLQISIFTNNSIFQTELQKTFGSQQQQKSHSRLDVDHSASLLKALALKEGWYEIESTCNMKHIFHTCDPCSSGFTNVVFFPT